MIHVIQRLHLLKLIPAQNRLLRWIKRDAELHEQIRRLAKWWG